MPVTRERRAQRTLRTRGLGQIQGERTAFAATYTFLAITAFGSTPAEKTGAFIADLYPTNGFSFEVLVPWLRGHTGQMAAAK
jgi:hypothetical protein